MTMLKPIIAALLLSTSIPAFAVPEEPATKTVAETPVDTSGKKEMDEMMSIFSKMFDTSNLPEPEPARLELAKITASKLLPDGAYAKIMDDMMGTMLTPLFDMMPGLTDAQIATTTGASEETVAALTEEKKAAVAQIIDPNHKERGKQFMDVFKPMISEAMAVIEPAMRTGLTRAYARKFTTPQLTTINGFFTTPTGSAFARESFALQADPEVMQATFKALPAIISSFMGDEAKFKAKFEELPKQRELKDLSETEMQQLAGLLGVEVKSLEDHRTIATTADPHADETGEEPWYAEDAWATAERKKVKALETKYNAASTKSEAASEQSSAAYDVYEKAWQAAVDAARKRMLAEGWTPPPAESTEESADAIDAVAAL
jgi:Uncharacterized protein conserved in bacteria (DUF2059)